MIIYTKIISKSRTIKKKNKIKFLLTVKIKYTYMYVHTYNIGQNISTPSVHFISMIIFISENKVIKFYFLIF